MATQDIWRIAQVKCKGSTMRSTRRIERGELILSETPLLQLPPILEDFARPGHFLASDSIHSGAATVQTVMKAMAADDMEALRELHHQTQDDLSYVATNAFSDPLIEDDHKYVVARVYRNISRVNHSCRPNAVLQWHEAEDCGRLNAITAIARDTEITLDYIANTKDCLRPGAARRVALQAGYSFDCDCRACAGRGAAVDDALRTTAGTRYGQIFWEIDTKLDDPNENDEETRVQQLGYLDEYITILQQLGLKDWKLAEAYQMRARNHEQGICIHEVEVAQA